MLTPEIQTTLNNLRTVFPSDVVFLTSVAKYLHRDYRTLLKDRSFPVKHTGGRYTVNLVQLAKWMV